MIDLIDGQPDAGIKSIINRPGINPFLTIFPSQDSVSQKEKRRDTWERERLRKGLWTVI